jgi:non-heme chloroperoxidase
VFRLFLILFFCKIALAFTIEEKYIEVEKGVKLHVLIKGSGKDIVLIHGLFGSGEMFEDQFEKLPKEGFRVIAISLRGFGKSSKPISSYTYTEYARDIAFILNTLDIKNAILLGYSMGSPIVIKYLTVFDTKRIEKVILIGAPLPIWLYTKKHKIGFNSSGLVNIFTVLFTKRIDIIESLGEALVFDPSRRKEIILKLAPFFLESSFYAGGKSLASLARTNLYEDLKQIHIPVLLLHGKQDILCPVNLAYTLYKLLPNANLVVFEKSGHGILFEESGKVNEEILKFADFSKKMVH